MRRALIIVDVQNDFCPGGALAVPYGDQVVAPLNRLTLDFLNQGDLVVKTRDWHPQITKHFKEFGGIWPPHCVQYSQGAEFHVDLLSDEREIVISKGLGDENCYSGFDGTDLAARLHTEQIREVWVGGLATDYCVLNTVLDALKEGFSVRVLKDAVRSVELQAGDGERALMAMSAAGAQVV